MYQLLSNIDPIKRYENIGYKEALCTITKPESQNTKVL